jgi:DegV family protein with EDD domain
MQIVFENAVYRDKFEITPDKVYELLENEVPKSSLPYSEDIQGIIEEVISKGYTDAIIITVSSGLSGTNNMINLMVRDYMDRLNISVVDSLCLSLGLGFQVLECAKTAKETGSVEKAIKRMDEVRNSMLTMFVLKTLHYLKKGGRIGKVEGTVGDLLHLKPIISVNEEGVYHTLAKVRGRKKSIQKMFDLIVERFSGKQINLGIVQGKAFEEAQNLLEQLSAALDIKMDFITQISPVLGMHTGPGLVGIIAYEV